MRTALLLSLLCATLAACGYKSPLYLPKPPADHATASAAK
ncbi:LPS translocon maturation chaperone LptM [Vogesella oryzae]|nr:lipoprotein [Vogesella oryzae]